MDRTPTPHIRAKKGDFAKTVLMPGDPLRAKFIAETYLTDMKLVTDVRNMLGYTGTWKGKEVSVMGSGMGMPSIGIYSHELFNFYEVDSIIRIGSAGSLSADCHVRDIVLAESAATNSAWQAQYGVRGIFSPCASFRLLRKAAETAEEKGLSYEVGTILSSDTFYDDDEKAMEPWIRLGVLCVEMEAAALYMEAARAKKEALAILTISDEILTGTELSSEERQTGFRNMMELALELI